MSTALALHVYGCIKIENSKGVAEKPRNPYFDSTDTAQTFMKPNYSAEYKSQSRGLCPSDPLLFCDFFS